MSIISFRESVAASSVETISVEIGRPFINALTLTLFSSAVLTDQLGVRLSSYGLTVIPVSANGASNEIWIENHAPLLLVLNKEIVGPPYRIDLVLNNSGNAAIVTVSGFFEVYNTPYPQTRIKFPEGHEGNADPFVKFLQSLETENKEGQK